MRTEEFYWFMKKRDQIRKNKEAGKPWPWTDDPILQQYKFTNVKREHDRTTKWMRENFTGPNARPNNREETLLNCAFFRYFGTTEWAEAAGWQSLHQFAKPSHRIALKVLARDRLKAKQRVFTGAYVITNQGIKDKKENVVIDQFLWPFAQKVRGLVEIIDHTSSWEAVAYQMRKLHGFGGSGFMTKEVLQDALHTPVFTNCVDRNTWCPVGPGARRGLNRVFNRDVKAKLPESAYLKEMLALFEARDFYWRDTFDVELELHDIQFQLCEFDKYERVKHGEGRPRSKYRKENG